jgi:hypothetical protein
MAAREYRPYMRWEQLFEDLESQLEQLSQAERDAEIADRTRAELARVSILDRLRASVGRTITCALSQGGVVRGRLDRVGADFVLLTQAHAETVIPLSAIVLLDGVGPGAVGTDVAGRVVSRLGLVAVLRSLARDRSTVRLRLDAGRVMVGTVQRVGSDFLQLAVHEAEESPRPRSVRATPLVPLERLLSVERVTEPIA